MDPQRCFDEILELLGEYHATLDTEVQECIREDLACHLEGLAHWIDSGGFVPHVRE